MKTRNRRTTMRSMMMTASLFVALEAAAQSGGVQPLPKTPPIPQGELKVPTGPIRVLQGDLTVVKAEARVYMGGLVPWVAKPKVGVEILYCVRNVGSLPVKGPIYAKFYWTGVGPFSAVPPIPGMQGSLSGTPIVELAPGAGVCDSMKLTFDSTAMLDQLGVLKKSPTVGVWGPTGAESSNPNNQAANNTKPVQVVSAMPS